MSEKELPSQAEMPEPTEPKKPILLVNCVQEGSSVEGRFSLDDEPPMANEEDVEEVEDIIVLTEEVVDIRDEVVGLFPKSEERPNTHREAEAALESEKVRTTEVKIVSHGEMRGIFNETIANHPNEIPAIQAVQDQEKATNAILEMIQEETQPSRPAVTKRTLTPVEFPKVELTAQEILKHKLDKLNKEVFPIGGTIKDETKLKIIGGDLLAIMEITEDGKNRSMLSEFMTGDSGIRKMENANSPLVYAKNFRIGIYLLLKMANGDLKILGGEFAEEYAEGEDAEKLLKIYEKLNCADNFIDLNHRIETEKAETKRLKAKNDESPEKTGTNQ